MKRVLIAAVASLVLAAAIPFCVGAQETARPKIYGSSSVVIRCDEPRVDSGFYSKLLPLAADCRDCGNPPETPFWVNDSQGISLRRTHGRIGPEIAYPNPSKNSGYIAEIGFYTEDEQLLEKYLAERAVKTSFEPPEYTLTVSDPEGRRIRFFEVRKKHLGYAHAAHRVRLIHARFVVKDRAAMDKFYKGILGFHVYWTGGMKDGETDWVDM